MGVNAGPGPIGIAGAGRVAQAAYVYQGPD